MTRPGWSDLMRYPEGAELRVELALTPALRDAVRPALKRFSWSFDSIESARLLVLRGDEQGGALECRIDGHLFVIQSAGSVDGEHVLRCRAGDDESGRAMVLDRVVYQLGGPRDAYLAVASDQGRSTFLHLSYDRSGSCATVTLFTASFRELVPKNKWPWLPSRLELARLHCLPLTRR